MHKNNTYSLIYLSNSPLSLSHFISTRSSSSSLSLQSNTRPCAATTGSLELVKSLARAPTAATSPA